MAKEARKDPSEGDLVYLPNDISPIPSGVYEVDALDSCSISLRIGKGVFFSLMGPWAREIHSIPVELARRMKTTERDFARRYYDFLSLGAGRLRAAHPDIFTMCVIDPRLAENIH